MRTRNSPNRMQKERKSEYRINILSSAARVHVSNTVDRLPVISPVATNIGMLIQYSIHERHDDVSRISLSLTSARLYETCHIAESIFLLIAWENSQWKRHTFVRHVERSKLFFGCLSRPPSSSHSFRTNSHALLSSFY